MKPLSLKFQNLLPTFNCGPDKRKKKSKNDMLLSFKTYCQPLIVDQTNIQKVQKRYAPIYLSEEIKTVTLDGYTALTDETKS